MLKKNPENMEFFPEQLIEHFIKCIEQNQAQEFPHKEVEKKNIDETRIIFYENLH